MVHCQFNPDSIGVVAEQEIRLLSVLLSIREFSALFEFPQIVSFAFFVWHISDFKPNESVEKRLFA